MLTSMGSRQTATGLSAASPAAGCRFGNGAAITDVSATPRANDELAQPIGDRHRHEIRHRRGILLHGIRQRNGHR